MTDLLSEVAILRRRLDEASAKQVRAQTQAEAAADEASRVLMTLREEFDVSSVDAARTRMAELTTQIQEQVDIAEVALAEAEGGASS